MTFINNYICIHGHFYQPPRENPWLEEIEIEESAFPFHDWNERVTNECYAPNAASRILGSGRKIIDIVNNYSKISFNFGPTLLLWLEDHNREVYQAILQADKDSQKTFSGHGSAIAQVYNHLIMPLATGRDKKTEIIWGIKDFIHRFGRMPEGMWLSETAVDNETLDILALQGIKFTILAPHQARRIRRIGEEYWTDVRKETLDTSRPYQCILPSGRTIAIFFYEPSIAFEVAFGNLLENGDRFTERLIKAFPKDGDRPHLVSVATDGETYGHHHRFSDMALAYTLHEIESKNLATITVYGEYLEKYPPKSEVIIEENTSWSCEHGVKRWEDNCGCRAMYACLISDPSVCYSSTSASISPTYNIKPWSQRWRRPLRDAITWLSEKLAILYEKEMEGLFQDPWEIRNAYGDLIIHRTKNGIFRFFSSYAKRTPTPEEMTRSLKLLEMQKNSLFMQTSCGWFFDDLAGIETIQILLYACRAIQLARDVTGDDLEPGFISHLKKASSNLSSLGNGADIYTNFVKTAVFDINRLAFQYAITSLIEGKPDESPVKLYEIICKSFELAETGSLKLTMGHALFRSKGTLKESTLMFVALHMGDHNFVGGIRPYTSKQEFDKIKESIWDAFKKSDLPGMILSIDRHFDVHSYSLWHLFPDGKQKVMYSILNESIQDTEYEFSQLCRRHFPFVTAMKELKIPSPAALDFPIQYTLNRELIASLNEETINIEKIRQTLDDLKRGNYLPDLKLLSVNSAKTITRLLSAIESEPQDVRQIIQVNQLFRFLSEFSLQMDLWSCQNMYYRIGVRMCHKKKEDMMSGDESASEWVKEYSLLGEHLGVRCYPGPEAEG